MQTSSSPTPTTSVAIVGTAQPSPPIVAVGLDWSVLIPLIFGGIAMLITTTVNALIASRTKAIVQAGAAAGDVREAKLDHITVLVNGRYSAVLQELADVRHQLAGVSGRDSDRLQATAAQDAAEAQAERVRVAAASKGTLS